jgi:hypothetical protein
MTDLVLCRFSVELFVLLGVVEDNKSFVNDIPRCLDSACEQS